jgi:hypothetical protein
MQKVSDDDISQRPSKIIREELQTMTEEHLQTSNLNCLSSWLYIEYKYTFKAVKSD